MPAAGFRTMANAIHSIIKSPDGAVTVALGACHTALFTRPACDDAELVGCVSIRPVLYHHVMRVGVRGRR